MPDGKPIPGQPKTSPAPLPPIINPVNYSHFEIEPTAMEYLRDRYCKNVEDSSSILDPFQDIQAEGEFKAGDFEKAADYLKRNYGNDEFDFCMRGTGTGGSFWGSENNTKGLSYTIHNTWWGYLMTDAMPLCQSISYTVNSNARMLPLRFEQLFNQTMMGVDQKTFPAERLKEAQELKETCLTALKRKHHARFDNNRVGLEWACISALKRLEVEKPGEKKSEQPIWPGVTTEPEDKSSIKPAKVMETEFSRRLGKLSWDEWVVLEGDVCRPYIAENEDWKKWTWMFTGGASALTVVVLRIFNVIKFSQIITEVFGILPLAKWGLRGVGKIWRRIFHKGPNDKNGPDDKNPPPPPPVVPMPEPKSAPEGAPEGGHQILRWVPVLGDPAPVSDGNSYQPPWWLPWVPALLGAEMMRRMALNPERFSGEAEGPRMPFAEAFKTLFEPVRPTFTLSRGKEMVGSLPRQSLTTETVRAATKGQTRRMRLFERQLRAVTRRGVK